MLESVQYVFSNLTQNTVATHIIDIGCCNVRNIVPKAGTERQHGEHIILFREGMDVVRGIMH